MKKEPYFKSWELEDLSARYPDVSPYMILQLSMIRYGATLTERAEERLMKKDLSFNTEEAFGLKFGSGEQKVMPGPVLLRDQSFVYINWGENYDMPYLIDYYPEENTFRVLDDDKIVDEISFVARPGFFGMKTRRGTPMESIADVRPQKLVMTTFRRCAFRSMKKQCAFCAFFTNGYQGEIAVDPEDAYDVVHEAVSEEGRFSEILLSGGTDLSGKQMFENEANRYIKLWQAIGRNFSGRFPSQLMSPAYPKDLLKRIYENTGITSYSPNIEIADRDKFAAFCPGKDRYVGYDNWIRSLVDAVDIFGPGNVCTQVVAGAELTGQNGFKDINEALDSNFRLCEELAKKGVIFLGTVWRPHIATDLGYVPMQDLEYFVKLTQGLHQIRNAYGLLAQDDDYRHCGEHADSNLERIDYL